MAAKGKALWQVVAAQLLLVSVPLSASLPEISALASARPSELVDAREAHPGIASRELKPHVRASSFAFETQLLAILRVSSEIASSVFISGFYYNRARWLDSDTGRFASVDPFEGLASEPLTLHKYAYAGLNAISNQDPTGRSFVSVSISTISIALTVVSIGQTLLDPHATVGQKLMAVGADVALSSAIARLSGLSFKLAARAFSKIFAAGRKYKHAAAHLGRATRLDYKKTFFSVFPDLQGKVVVHHAIEQQAKRVYPHLNLDDYAINSIENLRGIPKDANGLLHLSIIREKWNQFYRLHAHNPTAVTVDDLLEYATRIDDELGRFFIPPWR